MRRRWVVLVVLAGGGALLGSEALAQPAVTEYKGMCNASAAVAVGGHRFVVADDEDSLLRLYQIGQGEPLSETPIPDDILDLEPGPKKESEVDIEGAAQIGDLVYWIGSHSASKEGGKQPNRRRLFATRLHVEGERLTIERVGEPYKHLIRDLDDNGNASFHLKEAAKRKPKADKALSIEGLASTPDGDLLIGFRNPIRSGKALVARLRNPHKVIRGESPKFGEPIELNLDRRGIRSIERRNDHYVIVAGARDEKQDFKLYRWSGDSRDAPTVIPEIDLDGLNPEALFFDEDGAYILSDDGKQPINTTNCEKLENRSQRRFRGLRLSPPL